MNVWAPQRMPCDACNAEHLCQWFHYKRLTAKGREVVVSIWGAKCPKTGEVLDAVQGGQS